MWIASVQRVSTFTLTYNSFSGLVKYFRSQENQDLGQIKSVFCFVLSTRDISIVTFKQSTITRTKLFWVIFLDIRLDVDEIVESWQCPDEKATYLQFVILYILEICFLHRG